MSLVLELPTELEDELSEEATKVGMSLSDYALRMLSALQHSRAQSRNTVPDDGDPQQVDNGQQFVVLSTDEFEQINRRQKRLALREEYLRLLINDGHTTEELQQLLPKLDSVDDAWLTDRAAEQEKLFGSTTKSFQTFCIEQGVDYQALTDESFSDVVNGLIKTVRDNNDALTHSR